MKKRCIVSLSIAWLVAGSSLLFAQGVYVIQGDKGPVFTDQPQAGAKEVKLRPISVVPAVKPPPAKPASSTPAAEPKKGLCQALSEKRQGAKSLNETGS